MTTGVYLLRNKKTGKVYVGSSVGIENRFRAHRYLLERGTHHSRKLQNSWSKHGASAFELAIALICEKRDLLMYEQIIMEFYDAYRSGYNGIPRAGSRLGSKQHEDVVDRMREFQRSGRRTHQWKGRMLCLAEIAEMEGVKFQVLNWRVRNGWDVARAVSTPQGTHRSHYTAYGKTRTKQEWADALCVSVSSITSWDHICDSFEDVIGKAKQWTIAELGTSLGMDSNTFSQRIHLGWCVGDAATKPVAHMKLNAETAAEIFASTESHLILGKKYGVHPTMVGHIKAGRTWASATGAKA